MKPSAWCLRLLVAGAFASLFVTATPVRAQSKVMGRVEFVAAGKLERSAGVWVDGQYLGFVEELKKDKKKRVFLLPGAHEIVARSSGYKDFSQRVVLEPGQKIRVTVLLERDPRYQYGEVNGEVKLKVSPERAAVFVDDNFVGYAREFSGLGRGMLIPPGDHQIKLALPGYKDYISVFKLGPKEKFTIHAKLEPGSILQADPAIKKE
jgi:hypothetical protein